MSDTIVNNHPIMKCGHVANSIMTLPSGNEIPACVICAGVSPGATEVDTVNSEITEGRIAKCSCGKQEPSNRGLAFLEYLEYKVHCKFCGYNQYVHSDQSEINPATKRPNIPMDHVWTPVVGYDFDRYYCGHAGWD